MSVFSLFQALRKWGRSERERHAKSWRGGKKEEVSSFFPISPRFIFVFALSSIQRTRQAEHGTGSESVLGGFRSRSAPGGLNWKCTGQSKLTVIITRCPSVKRGLTVLYRRSTKEVYFEWLRHTVLHRLKWQWISPALGVQRTQWRSMTINDDLKEVSFEWLHHKLKWQIISPAVGVQRTQWRSMTINDDLKEVSFEWLHHKLKWQIISPAVGVQRSKRSQWGAASCNFKIMYDHPKRHSGVDFNRILEPATRELNDDVIPNRQHHS